MINLIQEFEDWLFDLPAFVGVPIMLFMVAIMMLMLIGAGALIVYVWTNGVGWLPPYILVGGIGFALGWTTKRRR